MTKEHSHLEQELENFKYPNPEKYNVEIKNIFHKWITKAINEKNKDLFYDCVKTIGKEWNVKRCVPNEKFNDFVNHLWSKKDDIINSEKEYKWWESKHHAYSYESKICFLINPKKYKIIYDSNTIKTLKKEFELPTSIKPENFQSFVNKYYEVNKLDTSNNDSIFETDFKLWQNGKNL